MIPDVFPDTGARRFMALGDVVHVVTLHPSVAHRVLTACSLTKPIQATGLRLTKPSRGACCTRCSTALAREAVTTR